MSFELPTKNSEFIKPSNVGYNAPAKKFPKISFDKTKSILEALNELAEIELCKPIPLLGNIVLDEGELCGQQVYFVPKTCTYWAFNPYQFCFEEITKMSNKVGTNVVAFTHESRPFTCEVHAPIADGPVTIDMAYIIATMAGALFQPSGIAIDATNAYLSSYDAVLANVNDESDAGLSTTCQALATDVETGKTKDLEPGGSYAATVPDGRDVPAFSIEVAAGSTVVVCGNLTNRINKSGEVVPK